MELAVSVAVDIAGEMTWGAGYVLTCPECGATSGWQLRAGTYSRWDRGESAEAACRAGHVMTHPLVYPDMISALQAAALSSDTDHVTIAGWRPHLRTETDYDLPPDLLYMVSYLPWEKTRHLPGGWWQRQWPELVAAS